MHYLWNQTTLPFIINWNNTFRRENNTFMFLGMYYVCSLKASTKDQNLFCFKLLFLMNSNFTLFFFCFSYNEIRGHVSQSLCEVCSGIGPGSEWGVWDFKLNLVVSSYEKNNNNNSCPLKINILWGNCNLPFS